MASKKSPSARFNRFYYQPQSAFKNKRNNNLIDVTPPLKNRPNNALAETSIPLSEKLHPYSKAIEEYIAKINPSGRINIQTKYPDGKPLPMNKTTFQWVNTKEKLSKMIKKLTKCKEIAVDTENHSHLSYLGILCLIQISSANEDYLVDSLALHDDLQELNVITTNPDITKVFHAASQDVVWLQRDFGVYIVNVVDTVIASNLLKYDKCGMATLLEKFCGVKKLTFYQKSDWRRRPLSLNQIEYARSDTHYLLYIKDCLYNELIDFEEKSKENKGTLAKFFRKSNEQCKTKYMNTRDEEKIWKHQLRRHNIPEKTEANAYLYYRMFVWREQTARRLDVQASAVLSIRGMDLVVNNKFSREKDVKNMISSYYSYKLAGEIAEECQKAVKEFEENAIIRKKFVKSNPKLTWKSPDDTKKYHRFAKNKKKVKSEATNGDKITFGKKELLLGKKN